MKIELEHPYWQTHVGCNIPGTQMTPALIGKGLLLEGGDEQVPGNYICARVYTPIVPGVWGMVINPLEVVFVNIIRIPYDS